MQYDPITWMQRYLKIVTMEGDLSPLHCNLAQLKVHNSLELQRRSGVPQRAIVLKARREGVSTYTEARCFYEINARPRRNACICSADLDASNKVFKMAKLFQDNMPEGLRLPTDYSNRKEIVYSAPHMSSFYAATAGKDVLGRGGLTHFLHLTEFAFWSNAKEQFGGAVQEVPDDVDTVVLIESTANGVGGAFHDIYMESYEDYLKTKDIRNYLPIFLPWYIFPKYSQPVSAGFGLGVPHAEWCLPEWCEYEDELVSVHGCTPEQLMWRRWAIKNRCQADLSLFKQEYPATVMEAFQSTGRPVFPSSVLSRHQKRSCSGKQVLFDGGPQPVQKVFDAWTIHRRPIETHQYTMGIDTMVGRLSDSSDRKSKRDYHGVVVLDRDSREVVATYRGQCLQDDLAEQCYRCCRYYNDAYVAPELPNGMQVLVKFKEKGYRNIFIRQESDDRDYVDDVENLGWKTTVSTRPLMVEAFKSFVCEEGVWMNSPALLTEMRQFVYDKTGKPIHASGKHDDLIFAAMIALQVHLRSPFKAIPYTMASTDEGYMAKRVEDLSNSGAMDAGPWAYEDEDLWITTE
jgi:hypothetical protein